MSAATEFAPAVEIPAQARRTRLALAALPRPDEAPGPVPDRAARASVRVLHAPSASALAAPTRLTRRGVVVVALVVATLGGALLWVAAVSARPAAAPASVPATVTVRPGDSLWTIAARVAPQRDAFAEIAQLQRRNHLTGVDLQPGQVLRVR